MLVQAAIQNERRTAKVLFRISAFQDSIGSLCKAAPFVLHPRTQPAWNQSAALISPSSGRAGTSANGAAGARCIDRYPLIEINSKGATPAKIKTRPPGRR